MWCAWVMILLGDICRWNVQSRVFLIHFVGPLWAMIAINMSKPAEFVKWKIRPIPRAHRVFDHFFVDCCGPFFSGDGQKAKYNYAFIAVDSLSRFSFCVALKSLTAKAVCDVLLELWQFTGCCSHISSNIGTNFTSKLTQKFEKGLGCSPRFHSPYHSSSTLLRSKWPTASENRRLRPISAYNVSTVRASDKCTIIAIGSRPRAFQRAIDAVRTLPLSPPEGGSKSKFVIFANKNRINSAKRFLPVKTSTGKVVAEPFPYLTVYIWLRWM